MKSIFYKTHFILITLLYVNHANAFVDSWRILKSAEDMIDILDTAQDVGETIEEDTPIIDHSKGDLIAMRRDLKELGYTGDEVNEIMAPYDFGNSVNTDSIRKLNRHIRRIKNLNEKILITSGLKGTAEGVAARESMESNVTLQNIHNELVMDRVLREKKETTIKRQELQAKIQAEKELKSEMDYATLDSTKNFGFSYSPFKVLKGKDKSIEKF